MGSPVRLAQAPPELSMQCLCHAEKIRAVHGYLKEHFPQYGLRDFHAPTRLMRAGLPTPYAEHHVVSLEHDDILPYYAVLLSEFLEGPLDDVCADLRRWEFAATLRAHRIAIVSQHGASAL